MATDTAVANRALMFLGLKNLAGDLALETNYRAGQIKVLLETTKTSVLEEHDWTFAGGRAQLIQAAGTPVSGWDFFYDLPADFLRARQVRASEDDFDVSSTRADKSCADIAYELREPQLLSDSLEVWMLYTRDLTNLTTWPQAVADVLSYKLAKELAIPLTESSSKRDTMEREHDKQIIKARGLNTTNDAKPRPREVGWVMARFSGSRFY